MEIALSFFWRETVSHSFRNALSHLSITLNVPRFILLGFFVMNGALQIIYKHSNLDQIPSRWRKATTAIPSSSIALALGSPDVPPDSQVNMLPTFPILLPGALGSLQVVDAANAKIISSVCQLHFLFHYKHFVFNA